MPPRSSYAPRRPTALIDAAMHAYHRHQRLKSSQSYSRYMTAQDRLAAYVQRMTDNRYYNLMNNIGNAVSTFEHDSSVWWKLIERITRPATQQHMTQQQIKDKADAMKLHQQRLLGPHTALDEQFDNEWFAQVNDYMTD